VRIDLNDLKNGDFDIGDKERLAAVKEGELRKDGKKMKNTSINLYCIDFFIVIKKLQKIGKNFCTNLIVSIEVRNEMKCVAKHPSA